MNKVRQGFAAEKIAEDYLIKLGYCFLKRRYWSKRSEIDLVMSLRSKNILVFVEVRSTMYGKSEPLLSITKSKMRSLHYAASHFLCQNPHFSEYIVRFDLITIKDMSIDQHIENIYFG